MLVWKSKLVEAQRDLLLAEKRAAKAEAISRAYAYTLSEIGSTLQKAGLPPETGIVRGVMKLAGFDEPEQEEKGD